MAGAESGSTPSQPDANLTGFLLLLGAAGLLVIGFGLGLLFWFTEFSEVQALGNIVYHENKFVTMPLAATPARLNMLRGLLLICGLVGLRGLIGFHRRFPLHALHAEVQYAQASYQHWRNRRSILSNTWALVLLAIIVLARIWYLIHYPLSTDEVASYDFFVKHGLLAITSFYPIPNNHILYNLLAWPLAKAGLPALLAMRLPSLLLGLLGTVAGYLLLARLAGERLTLAVTGMMALAPLWAYYAIAGRGYNLQFCLLQIGFFAAVELLRPRSGYVLLAWAAYVISSVLGLYLIPTYAYPLLSLSLGLAAGMAWQKRVMGIRNLLAAGAVIAVLGLVLYAPVAAVSGWHRLVANPYVIAKSAAQFWPAYRAYLYETAASLFGPTLRISGPVWLGVALLGGLLNLRLLRHASQPKRMAALLAWLLLMLPLVFMAVQRVYAPTRVLLYLTYFGYLLLALWLQQIPVWHLIPKRWQGLVIVLLVGTIGGFRLSKNQAQVSALQQETHRIESAYQWLRAHAVAEGRPAKVWMHAEIHELFFSHYEQLQPAGPQLKLVTQRTTTPTDGYDFLIIGNRAEDRSLPHLSTIYQVGFRDELVTIYQRVPTKKQPSSPE